MPLNSDNFRRQLKIQMEGKVATLLPAEEATQITVRMEEANPVFEGPERLVKKLLGLLKEKSGER